MNHIIPICIFFLQNQQGYKMSLNITELVENERIEVNAEVVLDSGQGTLRTKYMGAILNALGSYNTKTVALKKVIQFSGSLFFVKKYMCYVYAKLLFKQFCTNKGLQ